MKQQNGDRLAACRAFYAQLVAAGGGALRDELERAFESIPREHFLGAGPWLAMSLYTSTYVRTPNDDPIHLYQDVLFALNDEKHINNGSPGLHGSLLGALNPERGNVVVHVGCGTGYYTAILAQLVGPSGKVLAYEIEPDLAGRATENLRLWENVEVRAQSAVGRTLPHCDAIYVNAGATRPPAEWLDALNDGGRLVFPLSGAASSRLGVSLLVTRRNRSFAVRVLGYSQFISCRDAFDDDEAARVTTAFRSGALWTAQSLVRDDRPDETAVLVGKGWWLSSAQLVQDTAE